MSRRKLTGKTMTPAEYAAAQTGVAMIPVKLQVLFTYEGQPLGGIEHDVQVPVPTEDGQSGQITLQLDASELVVNLTQAVAARETAKRGGIVLPGANRPIPASLFKPPVRQD